MKKIIAWALVVLWMGLIFYLSQQPSGKSSQLSSGITATFLHAVHAVIPSESTTVSDLHFWVRKAAHFSAYLILGIMTLYAWRKTGQAIIKSMAFAWVVCIVYAASDEFHQLFIPGRSGEVRDVLIDSAGALTGIVMYWLVVLARGLVSRRV